MICTWVIKSHGLKSGKPLVVLDGFKVLLQLTSMYPFRLRAQWTASLCAGLSIQTLNPEISKKFKIPKRLGLTVQVTLVTKL